MRDYVTRSAQVLANPLVAGALAMSIVLATVAVAASAMRAGAERSSGSVVERVSFEHSMIMPSTKKIAVAAVQSASASGAPSLSQPQIARTGRVSLLVRDIDGAVSGVSRLARGDGGDVFSMDVHNAQGAASQSSGDMEIRVPARRFDDAMAALSRVGTVRERSTNGEDLTSDITDSSARLRNLHHTESDILRIMDRSGNVDQIMNVENQLSQVREQIETLQSQLKVMRGRVAYASIDVVLQPEVATAPVHAAARLQLLSAWRSAVSSFRQLTIDMLAVAIWVLVFLPLGIGVALVGYGLMLRKRRRSFC